MQVSGLFESGEAYWLRLKKSQSRIFGQFRARTEPDPGRERRATLTPDRLPMQGRRVRPAADITERDPRTEIAYSLHSRTTPIICCYEGWPRRLGCRTVSSRSASRRDHARPFLLSLRSRPSFRHRVGLRSG